MTVNLFSIKTAMRGMKIKCIITTTGNPAPKVLTKAPQGMPWAYWLAVMPPRKSALSKIIGPKKSIAQ